MLAEVALAVLVIAATAVLVRAAPPATVASGPAEEELDLGPMRLEMVIEPAEDRARTTSTSTCSTARPAPRSTASSS